MLQGLLRKVVPLNVRARIWEARKALRYRGQKRFCPVCSNHLSHFEPFGIIPREDAQCPRCGALERHRLTWLFLEKQTDLFAGGTGKRMLHVAPEACFEGRFRSVVGNVLAATRMRGNLT